MSPVDGLSSLALDKTIHEKARLMILTYLASSRETETGFTELKESLRFSAGNLSVQLKTLESANYVTIEKGYRENRPHTGIRLTAAGKKALEGYLAELEVIVASLKGARKPEAMAAIRGRTRGPGDRPEEEGGSHGDTEPGKDPESL